MAVALPAAPDPTGGLTKAPIRVLDIVTGNERQFGDPARYYAVAWSPDGSRLAALDWDQPDTDNTVVHLKIWHSDGKLAAGVLLEANAAAGALQWSPDGTRLAAIGATRVTVFDPDGKERGRTPITPLAGGGGSTSQTWSERYWSPDSKFLALVVNDILLVAPRDGKGVQLELPQLPAQQRGRGDVRANGWKAPGRLALVAQLEDPSQPLEWVGTVTGTSVDWGDPHLIDPVSLLPAEQKTIEELNSLVPPRTLSAAKQSADGSARVFVLSERLQAWGGLAGAASLVIEASSGRSVVDVGIVGRGPGWTMDVVVVKGWKGNLPARLDAVTPFPTMAPYTRTQSTPSSLTTPPPPAAPIPYPSPRGERVQPQVAGLPAYPGAVEIDGFMEPAGDVQSSVQMFSTPDYGGSVMAFFDERLLAQGFRLTSSGSSPAGEQRSYIRGRDRVMVSTEYIPRPEDEPRPGDQPPGFQGKGVPYLPGNDSGTWFFVVTLRAQ